GCWESVLARLCPAVTLPLTAQAGSGVQVPTSGPVRLAQAFWMFVVALAIDFAPASREVGASGPKSVAVVSRPACHFVEFLRISLTIAACYLAMVSTHFFFALSPLRLRPPTTRIELPPTVSSMTGSVAPVASMPWQLSSTGSPARQAFPMP